MTPHELRRLPLEAKRHARLAALDAVLRELCPRAPSAAEVQRTAARLYSGALSTLHDRPAGMPVSQSDHCMYAHSNCAATADRRASCSGMVSVPGDGLEHGSSPDDQRLLEHGGQKDHLTRCQDELLCRRPDSSMDPPELSQSLPASNRTSVASDSGTVASNYVSKADSRIVSHRRVRLLSTRVTVSESTRGHRRAVARMRTVAHAPRLVVQWTVQIRGLTPRDNCTFWTEGVIRCPKSTANRSRVIANSARRTPPAILRLSTAVSRILPRLAPSGVGSSVGPSLCSWKMVSGMLRRAGIAYRGGLCRIGARGRMGPSHAATDADGPADRQVSPHHHSAP